MTGEAHEIRDECGTQRLLGYVIDIGRGDGTAAVRMTLTGDHLNRQGILHGGIAALLLDTAMGACASLSVDPRADQRFSTLSLTTNFLAPGRPGAVQAVARLTGGGFRTRFADAVLCQMADGTVIATATGVFRMSGRAPSPAGESS